MTTENQNEKMMQTIKSENSKMLPRDIVQESILRRYHGRYKNITIQNNSQKHILNKLIHPSEGSQQCFSSTFGFSTLKCRYISSFLTGMNDGTFGGGGGFSSKRYSKQEKNRMGLP
jgi:hypothetical protein